MRTANISKSITITVLGLALCASGVRAAQDRQGDQRGQFTEKDYKFLKEAAEGGMLEVRLGKLASEKGRSEVVKQFGERMVQAHSQADQELRQIAAQKGAALPPEMSHHENSQANRLEKAGGVKFDKEYAKHMVKDHKKDIKEYEKAAQNVSDPQLRAFAQKNLPVLQEHERLARQMEESVKSEKSPS